MERDNLIRHGVFLERERERARILPRDMTPPLRATPASIDPERSTLLSFREKPDTRIVDSSSLKPHHSPNSPQLLRSNPFKDLPHVQPLSTESLRRNLCCVHS